MQEGNVGGGVSQGAYKAQTGNINDQVFRV